MAFLDELKRRARSAPGYAGGTLEDQLLAEQGPQGQVLTPTNREAITRPREVNPQPPADMTAAPDAGRQRAVSFDPQTGRPNEDFYRSQGDTQGLHQAYNDWQPRGAKRGFKNSLKAGAMMAAEAVRNNPNDPVTAALAGFATGAGGSAASPNFKNRLLRQWKQRETGAEAAGELELRKQQNAIDMGQLVPVQLEDGSTVMVPARTAGSLQSQQQRIKQQGDTLTERKRVNTDRKNRWDTMDKRDRMRNIISLYNSGGLNDPELLEYAADQLGLPAPMREKFVQGRLRDAIDEQGNLIQVDRSTGVVTPVTAALSTPATRGRAVGSFQKTQEAGRTARAATREARMSQPKPAKLATTDRPTLRKAAELAGQLDRARQAIADFDAGQRGDVPLASAKQQERQQLIQAATGIASELNSLDAGYEAGIGEKGYPYYKKGEQPTQPASGGQYAGRRISKANVAEYARRHSMTADEAAKFLQAEGATIY